MLGEREYGYAVMTRTLDAYSLMDGNLETCKKYCREECVVVEMIPYVCGFNIRLWISRYPFGRPISYDKYSSRLSIWKLNIQFGKEYDHKKGKVVYDPANDKNRILW